MKLAWLIVFVFISNLLIAKSGFEETPLLNSAYQAIFDLKLDKATELIKESKTSDPNNFLVYHIENYIDFVKLFIGEDEKLYEQLRSNKDKRLDIIEKGDSNSPYYLFCQAEIKLQWAILAYKFDHKWSAGRGAYSAYSLLLENTEDFPNFIHNKKTLGAIHALGETLPFSWLRYWVDGSIKQGMAEINEVVKYSDTHENYIFKNESIAILALILFHMSNKKEEAWEVLNSSKLDPTTSPIAAFLLANIGQKTGRNDKVIEILTNKPTSPDRFPFYYLDYLLGKSKLNRLDKDANIYIKSFLDNFKGQNYIKEAYQKLAWYELVINDDFPTYKMYMGQCKVQGQLVIGSDVQANKEATGNYIPDAQLLKSRLYFDGGYYHKAYQILIKNSYKYSENKTYKLEYYYRLARVTEALSNYPDAIIYYDKTIKLGLKRPEYYACKSALQVGKILEHEKQYKKAKRYYKKCLKIEPVEYKNEIHTGANAGLDRLHDIQ